MFPTYKILQGQIPIALVLRQIIKAVESMQIYFLVERLLFPKEVR